ncbi:hypothetical protein ACOSQ2_020798 [Xanthoceras sorbifolium]
MPKASQSINIASSSQLTVLDERRAFGRSAASARDSGRWGWGAGGATRWPLGRWGWGAGGAVALGVLVFGRCGRWALGRVALGELSHWGAGTLLCKLSGVGRVSWAQGARELGAVGTGDAVCYGASELGVGGAMCDGVSEVGVAGLGAQCAMGQSCARASGGPALEQVATSCGCGGREKKYEM